MVILLYRKTEVKPNIFNISFEHVKQKFYTEIAELAVALWGYACCPPNSRRSSCTFPPEIYIFLYELLLLMASYISRSSES